MQYPVGYLSDRYDRRTITAGLLVLALVATIVSPLAMGFNFWMLLLLIAISAGVFGALYAISISQTFDSLRQSEMAAAMGPLVMAYAVGAIIGPLLSSNVMKLVNPDALFYLLALAQVLLLGFIIFRITQRDALPVEQQESVVAHAALGGYSADLDPRTEFHVADQPLSTGAELAVKLARSDANAAINLGLDIVKRYPIELLPMAYALAQVEGVDSKLLMQEMTTVAPENRADLAETIALAWPESATDIVAWLLDDDMEDAHQTIAGMAQAMPEMGTEIFGAAIEQINESDAEESAVHEFVDSYVASVGEHVEGLRPADRENDHSEEHMAEVYAVVAEAWPEQSVDLAQSMTEAVPTAAAEVSEALVNAVTGDDDSYDKQASEAISQYMENMADAVPEQFEEIAASIVEAAPDAAGDVGEALREWQEASSEEPVKKGTDQ